MLKKLFIVSIVLECCLALIIIYTLAVAGKGHKPVITFSDKSHDDSGPVEFKHEEHQKKLGNNKSCMQCHMKKKLFPMKRKKEEARVPMTHKEMRTMDEKLGGAKFCGYCHTGKENEPFEVPDKAADKKVCEKCHKKRS